MKGKGRGLSWRLGGRELFFFFWSTCSGWHHIYSRLKAEANKLRNVSPFSLILNAFYLFRLLRATVSLPCSIVVGVMNKTETRVAVRELNVRWLISFRQSPPHLDPLFILYAWGITHGAAAHMHEDAEALMLVHTGKTVKLFECLTKGKEKNKECNLSFLKWCRVNHPFLKVTQKKIRELIKGVKFLMCEGGAPLMQRLLLIVGWHWENKNERRPAEVWSSVSCPVLKEECLFINDFTCARPWRV